MFGGANASIDVIIYIKGTQWILHNFFKIKKTTYNIRNIQIWTWIEKLGLF